jgi:probable F420-dependent oxidoreductase
MQYWQAIGYAHPDELLEIAPVAEAAGFEGLLLSDHVVAPEQFAAAYPYSDDGAPDFDGRSNFPEAWATICSLSQLTSRLRFATNVYILPLRHPVEVAKHVSTAAVYSQNRAILGVGAGWMREEFDILGQRFEQRGERMDEAIEVIQKLLTGDIVAHEGKHYAFPPLRMQPSPTQPVPLWIGGINRVALQRAARCADGWSGAGHTVAESERILTTLAELRREYGRAERAFDALVPLSEDLQPAQLERLRTLGMTGLVRYPFPYTLGANATLTQKLDALRRFGDEVIGRTKD